MSSKDNLPPCRMVLRTKNQGAAIYNVQSGGQFETSLHKLEACAPPVQNATMHACSPNGTVVLFQTPTHGIVKRNVSGGVKEGEEEVTFLEDSTRVQNVTFSPLGTYIVTWERPAKKDPNNSSPSTPNMKVWNASTGAYLVGFHQKAIKKESWPTLRWTDDEALLFLLVTNEIKVFPGQVTSELPQPVARIRCTGIASFSLAPLDKTTTTTPIDNKTFKSYLLSTFVPETKGKPAKVSLLRYPDRLGVESQSLPMLAGKSFFQAEEVSTRWSPKGDAVLLMTHTTVDASGESYYGSTNLHLLRCDTLGGGSSGKKGGDASISVPLPNGGPVMDVAWCPNPKVQDACFAVIAGKMPAMASLHDGVTGEATFLFGTAHRNTVVWSPSGRFVCLAGFGNLAGGMDFWDRNKQKKIPQCNVAAGTTTYGNNAKAAACCYGWSPDSRAFHVSTTSPRMNVDNGVRLYKYNGYGPTCDFTQDLLPDKLLYAEFLPAPPNMDPPYPDRPQTPPPPEFRFNAASSQAAAGTAGGGGTGAKHAASPAAAAAAASKPVQAYVPPSARRGGAGGGGGGSLAARMRAEREGTSVTARKVIPRGTIPGMTPAAASRTIPGATPAVDPNKKSKQALKREKQRQKKKLEKEQEEMRKKEEERLAKEAKEKAEAEAKSAPVDAGKRAKKINKLLKQIEELKLKDVGELNEDQKKKIGSEGALRKELAELGV